MPNIMKVHNRLESFPPILCRLMAKKGGRPRTTEEMAILCQLSEYEIEAISKETDWRSITVGDAHEFLQGCGLWLDDTKAWRRVDDYLSKKPNLEYLRKSPHWKSYYLPLVLRWRSAYPEIIDMDDLTLSKPVRDLLHRLTAVHSQHVITQARIQDIRERIQSARKTPQPQPWDPTNPERTKTKLNPP